jgi:hypothetical protein
MEIERPAPASIDLARAARHLVRPASAGLLILGALAGLVADRARPTLHARAFAMSLPAVKCPPPFTILPFEQLRLPAGLLEGYRTHDSAIPAPLRDTYLDCRLKPDGDRSLVTCAVRGPEASLVEEIARAAESVVTSPKSALAMEMAHYRLIGTCGPDYFARLVRVPPGSTNPRAGSRLTPELLAAEVPLLSDTRLLPAPPAAPPLHPGQGALLGLVLGALLAVFAAALRAREQAPPPACAAPPSHFATAALLGLMLTASMDKALAFQLGGFTIRAAQFFALALFIAVLVERRRLGRALALPAVPLLGAIGYLCVCAASALPSDNPLKSAGYLAWASFDVFGVLVGLACFACTQERLETALRGWWAGMALAAAMGAFQIIAWLLGYEAPLITTDIGGFPRINGFNYEPSYYALYLLPGALVLLTRFAHLGARAKASGLLAGALLLAVALSTSRSGWLGIAVGLCLLSLRACARLGRKAARRLGLAGAGLAAALALVLLAWPAMRANVAKMARMGMNVREVTSSGPRLESMRQAGVLFSRYPVLGVGFGNYGAYVLSHPELPNILPTSAKALVTTNLYLEIASETGATGLLASLTMLLLLLRPLWRSTRARPGELPDRLSATREGLLLAALVTFLVLYQFSQTLWRLDVWVLLAIGLAAALLPTPSSGEPPR